MLHAPPPCTPATKIVASAPARVFCGPAEATVHVGSHTYRLHGGSCIRVPSGFALNTNGKRIALRSTSTVTLSAGGAKGSFSGRDLAGRAVSGTFSC